MEPHSTYSVMLAKIRAFRATKEVIADALKSSDITIMQWLLLGAIDRNSNGFTTTTILAEELSVSLPMVTRLTTVAKKNGWISAIPLKEDKRTRIITLTVEGKHLLERTEPVAADALKEWLQVIPHAEIRTYITVLLQVAHKI